jgi:hypothetical protein
MAYSLTTSQPAAGRRGHERGQPPGQTRRTPPAGAPAGLVQNAVAGVDNRKATAHLLADGHLHLNDADQRIDAAAHVLAWRILRTADAELEGALALLERARLHLKAVIG